MKSTMNIPIFIPHEGCKNDCVFCNQRKISGAKKAPTLEEISGILDAALSTRGSREFVEIAFFGGSFTGLDLSVQEAYLDIATQYVEEFQLKGIRLSTRPDYIDENILLHLKKYPVVAIELGVQSLDEEVLLLSKRNHTIESVYKATRLIKEANIELGLQMMVGLPGDCLEKSLDTARKIIELRPDTIRIYPTLVIKDTELEQLFYQGDYIPLTLEEAVFNVSRLLPLFENEKITVLRIGLQANEGLNSDMFIAGPYHPAFKELVEDRIIYDKCRAVFDIKGINDESIIEIISSPKIYQRLMGHKKENYRRFILYFSRKNQEKVVLNLIQNKEYSNQLIQVRAIQSGTVFSICL